MHTPDPFLRPILEERSLSVLEVLSQKERRGVYLVSDPTAAQPRILKVNKVFPAKLRREATFLRLAARQDLLQLKVPALYGEGEGWMLIERLDLTHYTRDTVLEKNWDREEVHRWIAALREFQEIPQPPADFSRKEKLKGALYPLVRMLEMRKAVNAGLTAGQRLRLGGMLLRYLLYRPFVRLVTTHYDLNTFNFTNEKGSDKLLMIDFEAGAFRGDSLYDLLYYLTLPTVSLEDWTFQRDLLSAWIGTFGKGERCLSARLRLLLVVLSLQRIQRFHDDPDKAQAYQRNFELLFDDRRYRQWRDELFSM